MDDHENIDEFLRSWPYEPGNVMARRAFGDDGRDVLQMRIEMGLLQMEIDGRPDGQRPGGAETYYDFLLGEAVREGESFVLTPEQCEDVDREFVQFYHRRICWLALREYRLAKRDAEHTLELMEFSSAHAPDEQWILSHEQYRPYVMFHHAKASALAVLEERGAEEALGEIDRGLNRFRDLYAKYDAPDYFDQDELVSSLTELKESIRSHYQLGPTLAEELDEAIKTEQYERAAELRDQLQKRQQH